ncbi:MAG: malto-oligosyltrehalose synthase [Desulfomonile tiedjei]|uniref:Malto-oligosyltrehalose synthase n=1 Tax=Desulfomonile tiedjei TaxID=2358 RepID=A0A9D6V2C0_9BACT|nr:malto-oligosyltrehalose synthase [Desulfomonile tiedjei]
MRIPIATYRLQFNPSFGFNHAGKVLPYLAALGISHIYASPIFKARKGSQHGYDIVDPNQLNPELGSADDFDRLLQAVHELGMDWIQDIVPNHMAFHYQNEMLMDVLESGRNSQYFHFFDIAWENTYADIEGKALAPFLGRFYGESLEDGEITLHYGREGLTIRYHDLAFPVRIDSYPTFFSHGLGSLKRKLGEDHPDFIKLLGVLYVLRTLPSEESAEDYYSQVKFIKRMLWDLHTANSDLSTFVAANLRTFNGERGNPDSFALLDNFLSNQLFRLSFWKVATKEINYRRFFTINELISLRVEEEDVLNHTHGLVFDLLQTGKIAGIRIDHVDGLHDPTTYLKRIRDRAPEGYIVIEKILESNENLRDGWPIQGTTGYDFANHVSGLFCERRNQKAFKRIYSEFTGARIKFNDIVLDKKKLIIFEHMAGDVNNLAQLLKTISSRDRHGTDVTLYGLRRALTELLAAFPVYRTYINGEGWANSDRNYIQTAVDRAINANPALSHELLFIKRFLLMEFPAYLGEESKTDWLRVTMRFQQMTGPLMAKGFEDTTLYVYNRLISLNEVGGRPDRFGCSAKEFYRFSKKRQRLWPDSLNATSTHDSKRGEDVRARINVLSEIPEKWENEVKLWSRMNKGKKKRVRGAKVPDRNDEYFLYQTLVGAFPFRESEYSEFRQRIKDYVTKAVREAKVHTEWIKPDAEYEEGYISFVESLLEPSNENPFLQQFLPFQRKISHYGICNSLSQTLIKITSPGVPDFYQGTELWDLSLVDPDNRRPVDFEKRCAMLSSIRELEDSNIGRLIQDLLSTIEDGKIKLFLIYRALIARKTNRETFREGAFLPLETAGRFRGHVIAFARKHEQQWAVVIAPRFLSHLVQEGVFPLGREVWQDTEVIMPDRSPSEWRNALTNEVLSAGNALPVGDALLSFPVALLMSDGKEAYLQTD